jgi:membrane protein required for beta-lactamase induction
MTMTPLDSRKRSVRFIERWQRGAVVLLIVAIGTALPVAIIGALAMLVDALAGTRLFGSGALLVGLLFAPYIIGQRDLLRHLGGLARVSDD